MNIRELIKQDQGIDIPIAGGSGHRDDPFVLEALSSEKSAYAQMQLINSICRGFGQLWRIESWEPTSDGNANEAIQIETMQFDPETIITEKRTVYFDTRSVVGAPHLWHPLAVWKGPPGTLMLPYELGWLHFTGVIDNSGTSGDFDQTVQFRGTGGDAGIHASMYVYKRPYAAEVGARDAELNSVCSYILTEEMIDPWPARDIGPFAMKFLLSGDNLTVVSIAVSGGHFIKIRLTHLDDPKLREAMSVTLGSLLRCVEMGCD